jgi:hypothetical protein
MRRTSQLVGLDFSTGRSVSPLPVMDSVAKAQQIFMTFRELRHAQVELNQPEFTPACVGAPLCQLGKLDVD